MAGVVLPVLNAFLKRAGWHYDAIGVATAISGVGTLLMQTPAGWITDKFTSRRFLFIVAALATGVCFAVIPLIPPTTGWIDSLLFLSGATQTFFAPLLGALALGMAGHAGLNRLMGTNQGWNHAGNIVAALSAMAFVSLLGIDSIFYSVGACSFLAAASVLLIRERDLDERVATGLTDASTEPRKATDMLRDRKVQFALLTIFLFHLANAPILPAVALYVKKLGGSDSWMTATVLTAQVVMVPVALVAGRMCDRWGIKLVLAVAFWVLPFRIASYALVRTPSALVYLQGLDGIGAGIYGVASVALAADITRGKGGFNVLNGLFATALAVGGVLGPLVSGSLVEHFGFRATFCIFAFLALIGAAVFTKFVPDARAAERIDDQHHERSLMPMASSHCPRSRRLATAPGSGCNCQSP